jgi:hypothetical protein
MQLRATLTKLTRAAGQSVRQDPPAAAEPISGWQRAATKYDVGRMTKNELRLLAEELFAAGAISRPDLLLLSFDPDTRAPHWPDRATVETPVNCEERLDWINEVGTRVLQGYPDYTYMAHEQRLLSLLARVEAARNEMLEAARADLAAKATPEVRIERAAASRAVFGRQLTLVNTGSRIT